MPEPTYIDTRNSEDSINILNPPLGLNKRDHERPLITVEDLRIHRTAGIVVVGDRKA